MACGHLPVRRGAEVLEALRAQRRAHGPPVLAPAQLHVAVHGIVDPVPSPGCNVAEAREAVGSGAEALRGEGADFPRRGLSDADLEVFVPELGPTRHVDHVVDRVVQVEVGADLPLHVDAGVEGGGGLGTQRRVDGVVDEEVDRVLAEATADVPQQAAVGVALQPHHQRRVRRVAPELRCEAPGEHLLEGEAVGIIEHPAQRHGIRYPVGDLHHGAVGRAVEYAVLRIQDIAHQESLAAVQAEDARARVGVPEEEPARNRLAGVVGVPVDLQAVAEEAAEVGPQLQVVVDGGRAPDLGGIPNVSVAGGDERGRVVALDGAARGVRLPELGAQVDETGFAQGQADVSGDGVGFAVALPEGARSDLHTASRWLIPEREVDHPGDGVGTVLRRCAVAQHFDLAQRNGGNGRQIGPLCPVGEPAADPCDDSRPVAPLPVHEHQRVVRGQAAQTRRAHDLGRVSRGLRVHVEGRDHGSEQVVHIRVALVDEVLRRYGIDRYR